MLVLLMQNLKKVHIELGDVETEHQYVVTSARTAPPRKRVTKLVLNGRSAVVQDGNRND